MAVNDQPKYSDNNYRFPGDFRSKDIILYNYGGNAIDISKVTALINIYQDLDNSFVSGNLLFFDQTATTDKLPIIGNEFLEFNFRTPIEAGGDEELSASNHRFQVYQKKSVRTTQNTQAVALFFASIESVRNERIRINKSLDGTYHEMVNKIVKNKENLNSKKNLYIDPTNGNFKITFPNKRPADAIKMITTVAEPRDFVMPDYMFFENNRGFHFRSLESLYRDSFDKSKNRPFVAYFDLLSAFNPNFEPTSDVTVLPFTKPLSFSFDNSYDTLGNTRLGMFANRLYLHDMIDKTYYKSDYNYTQYYDKALHIDAPEGFATYQGVMPPGPAEFDDIYNITDKSAGSTNAQQVERINTSDLSKSKSASDRKFFDDYPSRVLVSPYTRYNHSNNINGLSKEKIMEQKRAMSKNLRDYFSMTIDVPGNFTYNVGDLVWCEVPTYNAAFEDTKSKLTREGKIDKLLTGRYLIKSVHHQIDIIAQRHTTAVKVCRNTFASKLPNADEFKANATFRSQPIDPIGSGIDLSNLQPLRNALDLKIPTPQISTVEDVATALGVDINSTDINTKDAANKAVNNAINSTTNRVLQNKYLAQVNSVVTQKQSVFKKILSKTNIALGYLNTDAGQNVLKTAAPFVQAAKIAFNNTVSRVGSFFRGFF